MANHFQFGMDLACSLFGRTEENHIACPENSRGVNPLAGPKNWKQENLNLEKFLSDSAD